MRGRIEKLQRACASGCGARPVQDSGQSRQSERTGGVQSFLTGPLASCRVFQRYSAKTGWVSDPIDKCRTCIRAGRAIRRQPHVKSQQQYCRSQRIARLRPQGPRGREGWTVTNYAREGTALLLAPSMLIRDSRAAGSYWSPSRMTKLKTASGPSTPHLQTAIHVQPPLCLLSER